MSGVSNRAEPRGALALNEEFVPDHQVYLMVKATDSRTTRYSSWWSFGRPFGNWFDLPNADVHKTEEERDAGDELPKKTGAKNRRTTEPNFSSAEVAQFSRSLAVLRHER